MNIKSSQKLVEEANKIIETIDAEKAKQLFENDEITLIDVRDIRELWKEGTIKNSKHIPRGMLEFWLDPKFILSIKQGRRSKKNGFVLRLRL